MKEGITAGILTRIQRIFNTEGATLVMVSTLSVMALSQNFRDTFIVRWRGCETDERLALHRACQMRYLLTLKKTYNC